MALIKCSECGKEISDKAPACPQCGVPQVPVKAQPAPQKPAPPKPAVKKQTPAKKGNRTGLIIAGIAIIVVGGVALYDNLYNSYDGGGYDDGYDTYEEKVMTVEETEQASPARFLDADGTYSQNLWGDKFTIQGTITNSATVANYKDVVIKVRFNTKTKTLLDSKRYVIYDHVPAHSTTNFRLKVERPSSCASIGWDAVDATPY